MGNDLMIRSHRAAVLALVLLCGTPGGLRAEAQTTSAPDQDVEEPGDIVVSATRIKGEVETPIPPIVTLSEADIAAYGAGSLRELLAALAPQTGTGRGRGDGAPARGRG